MGVISPPTNTIYCGASKVQNRADMAGVQEGRSNKGYNFQDSNPECEDNCNKQTHDPLSTYYSPWETSYTNSSIWSNSPLTYAGLEKYSKNTEINSNEIHDEDSRLQQPHLFMRRNSEEWRAVGSPLKTPPSLRQAIKAGEYPRRHTFSSIDKLCYSENIIKPSKHNNNIPPCIFRGYEFSQDGGSGRAPCPNYISPDSGRQASNELYVKSRPNFFDAILNSEYRSVSQSENTLLNSKPFAQKNQGTLQSKKVPRVSSSSSSCDLGIPRPVISRNIEDSLMGSLSIHEKPCETGRRTPAVIRTNDKDFSDSFYYSPTDTRNNSEVLYDSLMNSQWARDYKYPFFIIEFKANRCDIFHVSETFLASELNNTKSDLVIVEADRGEDLGRVIHRLNADELKSMLSLEMAHNSTILSTFVMDKKEFLPKRILRMAMPADLRALKTKAQDEAQAVVRCNCKIKKKKLPMEIVDAEYQWDKNKLTFYFFADRRIDFRELVRDLFKEYKVRIWMYAVDKNRAITSYKMIEKKECYTS